MTIDEKVAEKMGWRVSDIGHLWEDANGKPVWIYKKLPKFSSDWNATKILIKFMRERGFGWSVEYAGWSHTKDHPKGYQPQDFSWHNNKESVDSEIIDDNLPLAACDAFLQIYLEVK